MKALSVRQPWASLIAQGKKTIEIRSWLTRHRGELAIVASKGISRQGIALYDIREPRGAVVCVVDVLDVRPWRAGDETRALSDGTGCYSWELRVLYQTKHVPQLGKLSLFEIPPPPAS